MQLRSLLLDSNKNISGLKLLLAFWRQISNRRRFQVKLLMVLMLLSGISETISIGSVIPFLSVLTKSETIFENKFVQIFLEVIGIKDQTQLIIPVTLMFIFSVSIAAVIKLLNIWATGRLSAGIGSELSYRAFKRTLYQPYSVHISRNSSEFMASVSIHLKTSISVLQSTLNMFSAIVVLVCILIALFLVNWKIALSIFVIFGSIYFLIRLTARKKLDFNSKKIVQFTTDQLKHLNEGLGAIRDVIMANTQEFYLDIHKSKDYKIWQLSAQNNLLSIFPRYILEALGLIMIATFAFGLVQLQRETSQVIPILGAVALGAQKLLPTSQIIYSSWAVLRGNKSALSSVLHLINQPIPLEYFVKNTKSFKFKKDIKFENVGFRYSNEDLDVIKNISFSIKKGEKIGIIGKTGSGKSTLIDLMIGLIFPSKGSIFIDDLRLDSKKSFKNILKWRTNIAHVPQNIFLTDATIAENIAFGVPLDQINKRLLIKSIKNAQIDSFIKTLPKGFNTFVGERGVRLSGGQKQRIAVARALYSKAEILVFDEATSALDIATEEAIMDSINKLSKNLTVIMIAHRLSTVKNCDRIFELSNGNLIKIHKKGIVLSE